MNAQTKLIVPEPRAEHRDSLPAVSEASTALAMIERASRDPAVDLEKMRQLFALRKEIVQEEQRMAFNVAMNAAQAEMTPINADLTNPQTKSKYASYAQLDRAIRPIYTKHGFAISFDEGDTPKPEHVRCLAYVTHNSGYERIYRRDMPSDGKGAKGGDVMTKTHAAAAADSYGKRYLLKDVFNLAIGEADKDGNKSDDRPRITVEQLNEIEKLITEVAAGRPNFRQKFLEFVKLQSMGDIYADNFDAMKKLIESRRKKQSK